MKILFDHCTPRPLRRFLTSQNVTTADQHGWSRLRNGDLLNAAERNGIEIFITTDQNMEHAQDFQKRRFGTIIITGTDWRKIQNHIPALLAAVRSAQPGTKGHVRIPQGREEPTANEIIFDEQNDRFDLKWKEPETGEVKTLTSVKDVDGGIAWLAAHKLITNEEVPKRRRELLEHLERERERKRHR